MIAECFFLESTFSTSMTTLSDNKKLNHNSLEGESLL